MTHINDNEPRAVAADITYRHRALGVNSMIHSRRHGSELLPLLSRSPVRARYVAEMAWLASQARWDSAAARRVSDLAAAIERTGHLRPESAETCDWHAARLRELVRQYDAIARLKAEHRGVPAWPETARPARNDRRRTSALR